MKFQIEKGKGAVAETCRFKIITSSGNLSKMFRTRSIVMEVSFFLLHSLEWLLLHENAISALPPPINKNFFVCGIAVFRVVPCL